MTHGVGVGLPVERVWHYSSCDEMFPPVPVEQPRGGQDHPHDEIGGESDGHGR